MSAVIKHDNICQCWYKSVVNRATGFIWRSPSYQFFELKYVHNGTTSDISVYTDPNNSNTDM